MARFPFHYYKALRDEYIKANKAPAPPKDEDTIEYNADTFTGEAI